jgi:hypothetical protein
LVYILVERKIVMSPFSIGKLFRGARAGARAGASASVGTGARASIEGVAHVAQPMQQQAVRLRRLELPEGQLLDSFLPEVKHTKDAFAVIVSAEGGNPDAMLLLSDRFTSRANLLNSSFINEQLGGKSSDSALRELWTRVKNLRKMAMTLLIESAQRGNSKAQTRLIELVSQQGRK